MSAHTSEEQAAVAVEQGPEASQPGERPAARRGIGEWFGRHTAVVVAVLAVAAGGWAVVGSQQVFPYLSDDHDEGLYLLQADALAHGHLFPPAPEHADAFRPWLSVVSGGRYVLKYTPVHASLIALGTLAGSPRLSLGLIAGGVVVMSYLLAHEVLGDRRRALLATALLAASPLFLVQATTFLPYLSSLLLLESFAFALLRGLRSGRRSWLVVAGLLLGVAVFARPFDAILFAAPLGLYLLVSLRHQPRELLRRAGWLVLGAALPLVAMLLYYRAATGSPFRSPFSLLESRDTLGFGTRKLTPGHPDLAFTPAHGVYGVIRHVLLTSFWCFGGLVLIGFFVTAVVRRRRGPEPWLGLVAITVPVGYLFFWGTYGTGLRGSLTAFLGPFYFLPVLVPVTFLAAKGLAGFWAWDRLLGALAVASMVAVSGYLLVRVVQVNLQSTREERRLYAPLARAERERAVVFVAPIYGPTLLHPFAALQNAHDYNGRVVYALPRGEHRDLALLGDYPGRPAYRMHLRGRYRANPPDPDLATSLVPMRVVEQPSLRTTVSVTNPTAEPVIVVSAVMERRRHLFVLDTRSHAGKAYKAGLHIGRDGVHLDGPVVASAVEPTDHDGLVVSVAVAPALGQPFRTLYQRELGWEPGGPGLRVLLPGYLAVDQLGGADPLAALVDMAKGGVRRSR